MKEKANEILDFLGTKGKSASQMTEGLSRIGGDKGMEVGLTRIAELYESIGKYEGRKEGHQQGMVSGVLIGAGCTALIVGGKKLIGYFKVRKNDKEKIETEIGKIKNKVEYGETVDTV